MFKKAFDIHERLDAFFNIMAKKYPISENINTERIKQNKNIFSKSVIFIFPHYINIDCSHNILHISVKIRTNSLLLRHKNYIRNYIRKYFVLLKQTIYFIEARAVVSKR